MIDGRIVLVDGGGAVVNEEEPVGHGPANAINGVENVMSIYAIHVMQQRCSILSTLPKTATVKSLREDVLMFVFNVV